MMNPVAILKSFPREKRREIFNSITTKGAKRPCRCTGLDIKGCWYCGLSESLILGIALHEYEQTPPPPRGVLVSIPIWK